LRKRGRERGRKVNVQIKDGERVSGRQKQMKGIGYSTPMGMFSGVMRKADPALYEILPTQEYKIQL